MSSAEQDYYAEIVELRAELERVTGERDQYIERCEDLQTVQLRMVEELAKVEGEARVARASAERNRKLRRETYEGYLCAIKERDAARTAAARWKRSAKMWRRFAWRTIHNYVDKLSGWTVYGTARFGIGATK